MKEQDRFEELTQRDINKGFDYFLEETAFRRIPKKELFATATQLKINQLISNGEMDKIRRNAEMFFRLKLGETSKQLLDLYLTLKEGCIPKESADQSWKEIAAAIQEQEIKEEYINSALKIERGRDDSYLTMALKKITQQRTEKKFLLLTQQAKMLGIEDSKDAVISVLDFESRANQILYTKSFTDYIFSSCRGSNHHLNILYYICLRFGQQNGHLDISTNLEPFHFTDHNGSTQERNGLSKLFQLDTIKELKKLTRNLPNISHYVIVSNFDLFKYTTEGIPLLPKSEQYRKAVSRYLDDQIIAISETEYYQKLGFDEKLYSDVYRSIFLNDGKFIPISDVELDFMRSQRKGKKVIGNWNDEKSKIYSTHSIARSFCEGQVLKKAPQTHVCCFFDNHVKVGEHFNRGLEKKIPFIALPIFSDNVGGIELA